MYQKAFKGVFLALNLERRTIRRINEEKGLKILVSRPAQPTLTLSRTRQRVAVGLGNKEVWADVIATSKDFDLCLLALPENSLMGVPVCFCSHSANTWRGDSCLWLPASDDPGLHDQGDRSNCKRAFRIDGRPLDFQTTARLLTLLNNSDGCRPSRASIGRLRFSLMVSPRMRR